MGASNITISILAAVFLCITPLYAFYCPNVKNNLTYAGLIVGGVPVDIESVPWQVYVYSDIGSHGTQICGGSIVSDKIIVTAAHCLVDSQAENTYVSAGVSEFTEEVMASVRRIVMHPFYISDSANYDIGLIALREQLQFGPCISLIKLAEQDEPLIEGDLVQVTGRGAISNGGPIAYLLQEVFIPIINQEVCKRAYADVDEVNEHMFCAAYPEGGKGACQGDSGGPVVTNGVLVGVVSWSRGCARSGCPDVFTRIAAFRDWVDEESIVMNNN